MDTDDRKKYWKGLIYGLVFVAAVWLQFYGQRQEGYAGLAWQGLSLLLLLLELWLYNRRYTR